MRSVIGFVMCCCPWLHDRMPGRLAAQDLRPAANLQADRTFERGDVQDRVELNGRRLYEDMVAFWPTADEDPKAPEHVVEYARIWKDKPKVVFSTTLDHVAWNAQLVRDNISEVVERLKEQPGEYMSVGGAGLAASFMERDLIDEYWLYVHPVVLGEGKSMFPLMRDKVALQLIETRTFGSGVVLLRYGRAVTQL